ncbi:MAG: hypothetical protein U0694_15215 [Anaerolineae bacterium]
MYTVEDLQSPDTARRRQAIAQFARTGSKNALPALRQVQKQDPHPGLRELAAHAIQDIHQRNTAEDTRRKAPAMPSPFVEEVIQLTPVTTPPPVPVKRSFVSTLEARPPRQYSADPEQYEGSTQRNLLPYILLVVAIAALLFAALVILR